MKLSLRTALVVGLVVIQIVAIGAVTTFLIFNARTTMLVQADKIVNGMFDQTNNFLEGFFRQPERDVAIARDLLNGDVINSDDNARLERYFYEVLSRNADYDGIFLGRGDGSFLFVKRESVTGNEKFQTKQISIDGGQRQTTLTFRDEKFGQVRAQSDPADKYDPRTRGWYQQASKGDGVAWTAPYVFFTSKKPGITVALQIGSGEGADRRILGIDVGLSDLGDFLRQVGAASDTEIYLVNNKQQMVAHSERAVVTAIKGEEKVSFSSFDSHYPELKTLLGSAISAYRPGVRSGANQTQIVQNPPKNKPAYSASIRTPVNVSVPWFMGVNLLRVEIDAEIDKARNLAIIVAVIIALLVAWIGLMFARTITRPLAALRANANRVHDGELGGFEPVRSAYTELQETSIALSSVVYDLRELMEKTGEKPTRREE